MLYRKKQFLPPFHGTSPIKNNNEDCRHCIVRFELLASLLHWTEKILIFPKLRQNLDVMRCVGTQIHC